MGRKIEAFRLGQKFKDIQPPRVEQKLPDGCIHVSATQERILWAMAVNIVADSGLIKDKHVPMFLRECGWDGDIDAGWDPDTFVKKEPIGSSVDSRENFEESLSGSGDFISKKEPIGATERPRLGDGSGDAALAIGEHAFYAGYEAGVFDLPNYTFSPLTKNEEFYARREQAWSNYEPSEDIKELS